MNKIYEKYMKIIPKDLTYEQLVELISTIAKIEYRRKEDISLIQDWTDTVQEVLRYLIEKDQKGKKGLEYLKNNYSMAHFINMLHLECRNNMNYVLRKKNTQRFLYETDSLQSGKSGINDIDDKKLEDVVADIKSLQPIEEDLDLDLILSYIENTENQKIILSYKDETEDIRVNFSYKNFAELCYTLCDNKKLTYKDFKGMILHEDNTEVSDDTIKNILASFKTYLKKNRDSIFGGAI